MFMSHLSIYIHNQLNLTAVFMTAPLFHPSSSVSICLGGCLLCLLCVSLSVCLSFPTSPISESDCLMVSLRSLSFYLCLSAATLSICLSSSTCLSFFFFFFLLSIYVGAFLLCRQEHVFKRHFFLSRNFSQLTLSSFLYEKKSKIFCFSHTIYMSR